MKIFLQILLPPLTALIVWIALNPDEQRRLWSFISGAWEGVTRGLLFLWEAHIVNWLGAEGRPALVALEVNAVDGKTAYQGNTILETASYFTLNFIFQPPPGRCTRTHRVDISIADRGGRVRHQDRVSFSCGIDRRWMRFSSKGFAVSGQMGAGRWTVSFSVDGGRRRRLGLRVIPLGDVFTPDGGIVDKHSRSFGQKF